MGKNGRIKRTREFGDTYSRIVKYYLEIFKKIKFNRLI